MPSTSSQIFTVLVKSCWHKPKLFKWKITHKYVFHHHAHQPDIEILIADWKKKELPELLQMPHGESVSIRFAAQIDSNANVKVI